MTNETVKNESSNKPTHQVSVRRGTGKKATFERIGVAWFNAEKNSVYVKLAGTQIIDDGFGIYPVSDDTAGR